MHAKNPYEFYETPAAFTACLHRHVEIRGRCFEPCVGAGAIVQATASARAHATTWITNDFDQRRPASLHFDAADGWPAEIRPDWTITNPPFTRWRAIAERAIDRSAVGVACHLRASALEVLKGHPDWWAQHRSTALIFLPRFAFQTSPTTGRWTTDSMATVWVVWHRDRSREQLIRFAGRDTIAALTAETVGFRARYLAFA